MGERIIITDWEDELKKFDKINVIKQRHLTRYLYARSLLKPGDRIIDIACGTGYGSKMLADHGCHVVGIDISDEALEACEKYSGHPNVEYKRGDIYNIKDFAEGELDSIVCFETLEHIPDGQEKILEDFKSMVKKGQPIICSIPVDHPDTVWHKRIFSWEDRDELFRNVFDKHEYPEENASLVVGWS